MWNYEREICLSAENVKIENIQPPGSFLSVYEVKIEYLQLIMV